MRIKCLIFYSLHSSNGLFLWSRNPHGDEANPYDLSGLDPPLLSVFSKIKIHFLENYICHPPKSWNCEPVSRRSGSTIFLHLMQKPEAAAPKFSTHCVWPTWVPTTLIWILTISEVWATVRGRVGEGRWDGVIAECWANRGHLLEISSTTGSIQRHSLI